MTALYSLVRVAALALLGRVRFRREQLGRELRMPDGLRMRVVRHLDVRGGASSHTTAVFLVRFRFARFSHAVNRRLSLLPIPLIAGFPGLRQKVWALDRETGYWQGMYEFDSERAAARYLHSFVLRLMNRRAQRGSVGYRLIPHTVLRDYLQTLVAPSRQVNHTRAAAA